ncbi:MAG: ACP S-malonyltransferase [Deltaproteobacteria bacterium]|nr:ACP S-malonyltransferase [Deltaproteobacteria bacterium]MBW2072626.1 ACP S-malonyltransferase [Deltaproteobacteria bacterium]
MILLDNKGAPFLMWWFSRVFWDAAEVAGRAGEIYSARPAAVRPVVNCSWGKKLLGQTGDGMKQGVVFLFPGQGSQYVGMGRSFFETYDDVRRLFQLGTDILGMDLERLCFEGPEEELVLTENVQPAITLVNIACLLVLELQGLQPAAVAGHSLGEYSALYAAAVLDEEAVLQLVKLRGRRMQQAADKHPGAMAAILNLAADRVAQICQECHIEMANYNSPGQLIVSGSDTGVAQAMEMAAAAGARRCVRLQVSGPWHSRYMEAARKEFQQDLAGFAFQDPRRPLVSNVDAAYVSSGEAARDNLARQLCSPVYWQQSMERLIEDGYRFFIEVGPKKVLRGLLRQINREVAVYNVEDEDSLEKCLTGLQKLAIVE